MRRVRKFLSESDNLKEINRQRKSCDTSGLIDATLIEEIMAQIPQISNRNILRTLTILRKKLPKEAFQSNLKAVLQRRWVCPHLTWRGQFSYLWNWTLGQAEEKQHFLIDSSLSRHVKINKVRIPCVIGSEHSQSLLLLEFCDILDRCASEQMKIIWSAPLS